MDLKLGSIFGYKETFWVVNAIFDFFFISSYKEDMIHIFTYIYDIYIDSSLYMKLEKSEDVEIKHDLIILLVYVHCKCN